MKIKKYNAIKPAYSFYFFASLYPNTNENKMNMQSTASVSSGISASLKHLNKIEKEERTDNKRSKKLGIPWLIEHSSSFQHLWWHESLVVRKSQLIKPPKRYRSFYGDCANTYGQTRKELCARSDNPCLVSVVKAKEKQRNEILTFSQIIKH